MDRPRDAPDPTVSVDGAGELGADATLAAAEIAVSRAKGKELVSGTRVGEYEIAEKLGEGGHGTIYRAVHPVIGRVAAVKVLNTQLESNPDMASRFIDEARTINRIRHPNIIDVFSFGQLPDGRLYYVMELLNGEPLDAYLARGRMPLADALLVLRAVAKALDVAHDARIVHRDLKPGNIFLAVDEEGRSLPKLLDFGVAKLAGGDREAMAFHKTRTGVTVGTPAYMAPEQCRGVAVDMRADIYSLGVVAFELITGRHPFQGETVFDLLQAHVTKTPPAPSTVAPSLVPALNEPILAMLAKDPGARPTRASVAIDRLVSAAATFGIAPTTSAVGLQIAPPIATLDGSLSALGTATTHLSEQRPSLSPPKARPKRAWGVRAGATLGIVAVVVLGVRALIPSRAVPARPEPELDAAAARVEPPPSVSPVAPGVGASPTPNVASVDASVGLAASVDASRPKDASAVFVPDARADRRAPVGAAAAPSTKPTFHQALEYPF